jgi:hypothetical protein
MPGCRMLFAVELVMSVSIVWVVGAVCASREACTVRLAFPTGLYFQESMMSERRLRECVLVVV